ncbi:hypothetical protein GCM10027449_06670 [Sinomonas notoginsengisoli]
MPPAAGVLGVPLGEAGAVLSPEEALDVGVCDGLCDGLCVELEDALDDADEAVGAAPPDPQPANPAANTSGEARTRARRIRFMGPTIHSRHTAVKAQCRSERVTLRQHAQP